MRCICLGVITLCIFMVHFNCVAGSIFDSETLASESPKYAAYAEKGSVLIFNKISKFMKKRQESLLTKNKLSEDEQKEMTLYEIRQDLVAFMVKVERYLKIQNYLARRRTYLKQKQKAGKYDEFTLWQKAQLKIGDGIETILKVAKTAANYIPKKIQKRIKRKILLPLSSYRQQLKRKNIRHKLYKLAQEEKKFEGISTGKKNRMENKIKLESELRRLDQKEKKRELETRLVNMYKIRKNVKKEINPKLRKKLIDTEKDELKEKIKNIQDKLGNDFEQKFHDIQYIKDTHETGRKLKEAIQNRDAFQRKLQSETDYYESDDDDPDIKRYIQQQTALITPRIHELDQLIRQYRDELQIEAVYSEPIAHISDVDEEKLKLGERMQLQIGNFVVRNKKFWQDKGAMFLKKQTKKIGKKIIVGMARGLIKGVFHFGGDVVAAIVNSCAYGVKAAIKAIYGAAKDYDMESGNNILIQLKTMGPHEYFNYRLNMLLDAMTSEDKTLSKRQKFEAFGLSLAMYINAKGILDNIFLPLLRVSGASAEGAAIGAASGAAFGAVIGTTGGTGLGVAFYGVGAAAGAPVGAATGASIGAAKGAVMGAIIGACKQIVKEIWKLINLWKRLEHAINKYKLWKKRNKIPKLKAILMKRSRDISSQDKETMKKYVVKYNENVKAAKEAKHWDALKCEQNELDKLYFESGLPITGKLKTTYHRQKYDELKQQAHKKYSERLEGLNKEQARNIYETKKQYKELEEQEKNYNILMEKGRYTDKFRKKINGMLPSINKGVAKKFRLTNKQKFKMKKYETKQQQKILLKTAKIFNKRINNKSPGRGWNPNADDVSWDEWELWTKKHRKDYPLLDIPYKAIKKEVKKKKNKKNKKKGYKKKNNVYGLYKTNNGYNMRRKDVGLQVYNKPGYVRDISL
eukprot:203974_1